MDTLNIAVQAGVGVLSLVIQSMLITRVLAPQIQANRESDKEQNSLSTALTSLFEKAMFNWVGAINSQTQAIQAQTASAERQAAAMRDSITAAPQAVIDGLTPMIRLLNEDVTAVNRTVIQTQQTINTEATHIQTSFTQQGEALRAIKDSVTERFDQLPEVFRKELVPIIDKLNDLNSLAAANKVSGDKLLQETQANKVAGDRLYNEIGQTCKDLLAAVQRLQPIAVKDSSA